MMIEYLSLLLAYERLPRERRRATFMEVSGHPHYENVCSNVLAFYLDPAQEHGMGTLMLEAFAAMIGRKELALPQQIRVVREHATKDGGRLDLWVDGETFVLGIENKIHHWEANDLDSYACSLAHGADGREVWKVLLCLRLERGEVMAGGGFVRRTYPELWKQVRDRLGHRLAAADPKWVMHLNDFMLTTSHLAGETAHEKAVTDFFIAHHEVIERLVRDRQAILHRLCGEIRRLCQVFNGRPRFSPYLDKCFVANPGGVTLATWYDIQGAKIGLDLTVSMEGWTLTLFRFQGARGVLEKLTAALSALRGKFEIKNGRPLLQAWTLHATPAEMEEAMTEWFEAINRAVESLPPVVPDASSTVS